MHLPRRLAGLLPLVRHPLAPYGWALAMQLLYVGYVKDDAYIEYRYAANAAAGHGLTFNVGDPPVEGFTSFLFTLLLVVPAGLGLPLLALCKLAGAASLLGCIALVGAWVRQRGGSEEAAQVGRFLVATCASLIVWAQSGMEPVECALAVVAAAYCLERRWHWRALLLAAAAAALRPECHLVLGGALAITLFRRRFAPVLVALLLVAALHWFRWRYFGSLVPNTALVKGGRLIWAAGLRLLGELAVTSLAALPIALALVEAAGRRDAVALWAAAAIMAFLAYLVRIGRDEMILMRLFIPVWPLALGLAAPRLARRPALALLVCLVGVGFTAGYLSRAGYLLLGMRSHGRLAEVMKEHARPGELVIFQDLGQTPWNARELRFVDPIGLVDDTIGRIRWRDRASPFLRAPSEAGQREIRDHLFGLGPRLIALVAYVPDRYLPDVRRDLAAATTTAAREAVLLPLIDGNPYHCGLRSDPRFSAFVVVDVIRRKDNYWFVLYERV